MNHTKEMTSVAKQSGRNKLPYYVIGVIREIMGDLSTTAEVKIIEVSRVLSDFDLVKHDNSLPLDLMDTKNAPAPTGAEKEINTLNCNTDNSKIESLVDFPLVPLGPACKECVCFECKDLYKCRIISPSTLFHCKNRCRGTAGVGNCEYRNEED